MKDKKGKLFIELKRDIQKVLEEYSSGSGVAKEDVGFAMGYLTGLLGQDPSAMEQLMFIQQLYFFSGVYYAKTTKDFKFEWLTAEERSKKVDEIKDQLGKMLHKNIKPPSYMG